MKKLKDVPAASKLIDKLLYEALKPLASKDSTILAIQVGRRNLAVEILTEMEVIKHE